MTAVRVHRGAGRLFCGRGRSRRLRQQRPGRFGCRRRRQPDHHCRRSITGCTWPPRARPLSSPGSAGDRPNDPPNFTKCIAQVRKAGPVAWRRPPPRRSSTDCKQLFTSALEPGHGLPDQGLLVPGRGGAKLGIKITAAQVQKAFDTAKKQQFPTAAAIPELPVARPVRPSRTSCSASGSTRSSRSCSPSTRPRSPRRRSSRTTRRTCAQFGTPATRDIRIVLTKTKAQAQAAKARCRPGQSWDVVAKKYSTDPTSKSSGGLLAGVTKGQEDAALDTAAFSATVNKLGGPIKGQFGYYVFEVTKITKATQQTLAQATPLIKQTLPARQQTSAQTRSITRPRSTGRARQVPRRLRDGRLRRLQGAEDIGATTRRRPRPSSGRPPTNHEVASASEAEATRAGARAPRRRSRAGCGSSARGIASRTSARSCRTRSRRPTSWPTPRTRRDDAQAARRARRRAVPGPLPVAAARGARRRAPGRGRRALHREADPPPPACVRRDRGVDTPPRCCATGTRSSARRAAARAGRLRRGPREPAVAAVRAQGPAPRGLERLRLPRRRGAARRRSRDELDELETRRSARSSGSTSSATCCSRPSMWRGSCGSTPSSRSVPRPTASGVAWWPARRAGRVRGPKLERSAPDEQLAYYARVPPDRKR